MSEIKIDINTLTKSLEKDLNSFSKDLVSSVQNAVENLVSILEAEAIKLASEKLTNTFPIYANAIRKEKIGENTWVIYLDNNFANMLEDGFSSYDMKDGFLSSNKAKIGKNSTYFNVPINPKQASKKNIFDYRSAVEAAINDSETISDSKNTSFGKIEKFSNLKEDRLKGLMKITSNAGNEQFLLFRRVSTKSDKNKFIHPGYDGAHIIEKDLKLFAEQELDKILKKMLGA
jgi:hypothetical protein